MFRWNNRTPTRTCSCKIWGLVGFLLTLMIVSKYLWCRFYARTRNTRRGDVGKVLEVFICSRRNRPYRPRPVMLNVSDGRYFDNVSQFTTEHTMFIHYAPRVEVLQAVFPNRNLDFSHLGALFSDYDKEQIELPFLGVTSADLDIKTSEPSVGANIYLVSSDMQVKMGWFMFVRESKKSSSVFLRFINNSLAF